MPTISDLGYGTSREGAAMLMEDIRSHLMLKVSENAADISKIEAACNENWVGTSKDVFLNNLRKDVTVLQDGLNQMYSALHAEINMTTEAIMDFDQNLISEN